MKKLPVLFLIFCREEITLKTFQSIRNYKPDVLYIAADGGRVDKPDEAERCEQTRKSVLDAINWDCEIKTLFRDENLGCTNAVSNGISWFFEYEEYGIIIEDDCWVHSDFYALCENLLPAYRHEEKIMLIAAQNMTPDLTHADQLVFTNLSLIWGWASWRRAWKKMDMDMVEWRSYTFSKLIKNFGLIIAFFMFYYYSKAYRNKHFGSWDIRWAFSVLANEGLCISSTVNLSKNIGIEEGGTHYEKGDDDPYIHLPVGGIILPIQLPEKIELSKKKLLAERKDFFRIRKIGFKKIIRKYFRKFTGK